MKAEEYSSRTLEIEGWPVRLTSYRFGAEYHCTADNVDPGAAIARTTGTTREEAEERALERAGQMLGRTRRRTDGSAAPRPFFAGPPTISLTGEALERHLYRTTPQADQGFAADGQLAG